MKELGSSLFRHLSAYKLNHLAEHLDASRGVKPPGSIELNLLNLTWVLGKLVGRNFE